MESRESITRLLLGVLGNIASCSFFLSSTPTVIKIIRQKSLGGLAGDLYVFKLLNCMLWTFYGLPIVHPHNFWVILTNSFGCAFTLADLSAFLYYGTKRERGIITLKLAVILSFYILVVLLLLVLQHGRHTRVLVVGIFCVIISSCMHLSLLFQMETALKTRETRYIHPCASAFAFIKGAIWAAYGAVSIDIFIMIPNGVGVVIGFVQVTVILFIRRTERKEKIPEFISSYSVDLSNLETTARNADQRQPITPSEIDANKGDPLIEDEEHHNLTITISNRMSPVVSRDR